MKLIERIKLNKALRYYHRQLEREIALVEKYGKSSNLASFYMAAIKDCEAAKEYLKSKAL